ncbi:MAG: diaminopimelate epimerase [Myxococcota bacterium]|nr:diaminopimelate epimerase [Myxococcota bacterium]
MYNEVLGPEVFGMQLIKFHGLGNDYLVLESSEIGVSPEMVIALCERHTGVGADGVLEVVESRVADFGVVIHNPDGTQAEKSGNGLRIFSRYLVKYRSAASDLTVETPAGVVRCRVDGDLVEVEMGGATVDPARIPAESHVIPLNLGAGFPSQAFAVGMGNPHCVVFLDVDFESVDWRAAGKALEVDPRFPNRTNVQFVRLIEGDQEGYAVLEARIWERGAGETQSSGSSASAVAAAAVRSGLCPDAHQFVIQMPGGSLHVYLDWGDFLPSNSEDLPVRIKGPVEEVCRFQVSDAWLARVKAD